jgi:hypothetical protein
VTAGIVLVGAVAALAALTVFLLYNTGGGR